MDAILSGLEEKRNIKDKLYYLDCQLGKIKVQLINLSTKEQNDLKDAISDRECDINTVKEQIYYLQNSNLKDEIELYNQEIKTYESEIDQLKDDLNKSLSHEQVKLKRLRSEIKKKILELEANLNEEDKSYYTKNKQQKELIKSIIDAPDFESE